MIQPIPVSMRSTWPDHIPIFERGEKKGVSWAEKVMCANVSMRLRVCASKVFGWDGVLFGFATRKKGEEKGGHGHAM